MHQRVDQTNRREDADLLAMILDRLGPESGGDTLFAWAVSADERRILMHRQSTSPVYLVHRHLVSITVGELVS